MSHAPALRPLQITFRDRVGERFNGFRLHHSLRSLGCASRMLVLHRDSDDPDVHDFGRPGALLERALYGLERMTGLQGRLSPFGATIRGRRCFREADVVHWHLVYPHFVGIPWVPRLARLKPTVWTLHDPWATTGHCVHPLACERWRTGCGHCPDLRRNFAVWRDTTAETWRAKHRAYGEAPLTLVVSTRWMKERVEASPLLSSLPCRVIPFGLDLSTWAPADREASRVRLGIPREHRVIAFRVPESEKLRVAKGVPTLVKALLRLPDSGPVTLLALEARGQLEPLHGRFTIVEPGWIADEPEMVRLLSAADIFAMPSQAESFGFMAIEAMACGVPVVATAGTAVEDTIRPPAAGLTVPPDDPDALAAAIATLLNDGNRRAAAGAEARRIVEADYGYDRYLQRHLELYRALAVRGTTR